MKITAVFLLTIILFNSCRKEIEIDFPETDPKLVVNSLFTNDSIFIVNISRTTGFNRGDPQFISDADCKLYIANTLIDNFIYTEDGKYISETGYKPLINTEYLIKVSHKDFPPMSALNSVPQYPVIAQLQKQDSTMIDEGGYYLSTVDITIQDNPEIRNYYEIKLIGYYFEDYTGIPGFEDFQIEDTVYRNHSLVPISNDLVFQNEGLSDYYPREYPFSDTLFNGQEYTLQINYMPPQSILGTNNGRYNLAQNHKLIVIIRAVSEEYYKYRKKLIIHLENQYSDIWDGMASPVHMYSNINNAYGIFAGYSTFIDTIP